ncbi:MAG: hypothetical protein J6B25_09030 [Clostridia bacterium]|nr:hypothetical protein [Clostridia bacterium]
MLFQEKSYFKKSYMYTAVLDNGVTIDAYADGTADGNDGSRYRLVSHLDEDEEVVIDGWEMIEK